MVEVLDGCHAVHHLSLALQALGLSEEERGREYARLRRLLKAGWSRVVIKELEALAAGRPEDSAVWREIGYLIRHSEAGRLRYDCFRCRGVTGSAGTTLKVVNIVPAPTHSISLQYSFNGIVSSSSPVFTSTLMSSTTGPVVAPDPEAASSESTGMEPPAVAIAAAGARLTTHVEVADPGVSVGPLVARSSAPLRPPLGTTPGEPTPSIDRNERAFDLAALGSGAEVDAELLLGLTTNRSDGNGEDTPVNPAARTTEPLIALRGPGGLPVMVSSVRAGQSLTDPAAVLATLPAPENLPDPGQQLARLPALPPLEASGALRHGDEVACIDFLKAACGLMLGIGLTTGPLYPDLMALIRNFLPRRASLANAPRRSGARRKGPLRGFRRWLGLC